MNLEPRHSFHLAFSRKILVSAVSFTIALAGCRLCEREHYQRLTFTPGQKTIKVLMVGDSLTYYNDLPGILQQLSAGEPAPIHIEKNTFPFVSLEGHWMFGISRRRIREGHFDYVILQDFSRKPATDPENCMKYFVLFDNEVRQAGGGGGQTIIFQNWTRRGHDADYSTMNRTYSNIHEHIGAPIAPIGAAWQACAASHPDIKLLLDDRHPTPAGSYLAACVLYDTLYRQSSANLPMNLSAPDLPPGTLSTLRTIADQAAIPSR